MHLVDYIGMKRKGLTIEVNAEKIVMAKILISKTLIAEILLIQKGP